MPGAGFIGATRRRPRRQSKTAGSFAVTLTGLTGGMAQDGTVLGYVENGTGTPATQRWQASADGTAWANIVGAGGVTETVDIAGGTHIDTSYIRVGVTIDGVECFSNVARLGYAAPVAVGALGDQSFTTSTGMQSVAAAGAFAGDGLTFAVTATTGVAINTSTGVISFDTDAMPAQSGTTITVTAANSGGFADSSFSLAVSESVETRLVLTIETTTPSETFTLPLANGTTSATVDMGDGTGEVAITAYNDAALTGTYATPGTHTVTLEGSIRGVYFAGDATSAAKVRTVDNLGELSFTTMQQAFDGCDGMTSFVAGNCDTSGVSNWFATLRDTSSLVTCDLSGVDFSPATVLQAMLVNTGLTSFDASVFDTATGLTRIDECFLGATGLDDQIDLSGLPVDALSATGGMFDVVSPETMGFTVAVYDQMLLNYAAQAPLTSGVFMGVGGTVTDYTRGGVAEAARNTLVAAGWVINDAGRLPPEAMAAPNVVADSSSQITVNFAADPEAYNYPITSYDLRWQEDGGSWTTVLGVSDGDPITGLTDETLHNVQTRANSWVSSQDGVSAWSASGSATTTATAGFTLEETNEEPVITATAGNVSVTIAAGPYAGTYTQNVDSNTLTVTMIEAAPTPIVLPAISASVNDLTITPGLWLYDGPDLGDQTWDQKIDAVSNGETDLDYEIVQADDTKTFTVVENYGGETMTSAGHVMSHTATAPFQMGNPSLAKGSGSNIDVTSGSDPADNGGSAITSYDYRYATASDGPWTEEIGYTSVHSITGLAGSTFHWVQNRAVNSVGAGPWSASSSIQTNAAGDVAAPVLTLPTGAKNGTDGATSLGITTDEGNGTLYWGIYPTASTPSAADVVAGTGATVSGSQTVSATGVQAVANQTGLNSGEAYKAYYVHDDAAANRSNLSTTAEFTTDASFTDPNDLAPLYSWYDLTDTTKLYKETDRQNNVTTDGDIILGIEDNSGNGWHLEISRNGVTWDATNSQINMVNFWNQWFTTTTTVTGLPALLDLYVAVKPSSNRGCFIASNSDASFAGKMIGGDATSPHANAGTPTYSTDGVDISPAPDQDDLSTEWGTAVSKVIAIRGIDTTSFAGVLKLLNDAGSDAVLGDITHIVVTGALTTDEHTDLQTWLAARLPT